MGVAAVRSHERREEAGRLLSVWIHLKPSMQEKPNMLCLVLSLSRELADPWSDFGESLHDIPLPEAFLHQARTKIIIVPDWG